MTTATRAMPPVTDPLLDDIQSAAYLGLQPRTIRDWRINKGLPFLRLGPKCVRIRRSELDRWLDRHRHVRIRTDPGDTAAEPTSTLPS